MKKIFITLILMALAVIAAVSCKKSNTIMFSSQNIVGTPVPTMPAIAPAGFVDDCNDGDNANRTGDWAIGGADCEAGTIGPGYWYTYNDWASCCPAGTSVVWPLANTECAYYTAPAGTVCGTFYMQSPGCEGVDIGGGKANDDFGGKAARMTGTVTNAYLYGGAIGMGMNLIGTLATAACGTPGPAYLNISAYTGIKFWAKGDGQAYIIKIPLTDDCNTSVTGYDDYAYTFTAPSANWTQVIIPFTAFTVNTWGSPPANIGVVLASARALQWCTPANMSADLTADLWVDDIQFY